MRRRQGYTLVELLVSMALILTIMSILSTAYVSGLDTFSKLKGIGDMAEKLRAATMILRRDLSADHFTGAVRLSDPNFCGIPYNPSPLPSTREGFFHLAQMSPSQMENGQLDTYNNPSWIATCLATGVSQNSLHFTVKLRGNRQEDFITGQTLPGNFYSQSSDASYNGGYQWAEVAYFLAPILNQQTSTGSSGNFTAPQQLFGLYRVVLPVFANNGGIAAGGTTSMSTVAGQGQIFNTPSSLQLQVNRAIQIPPPAGTAPIGSLLLADVLNFDVQVMPNGNIGFTDLPSGNFDTANAPAANGGISGISAIQIIIRVYDLKSRQARQITLVQDL